MKLNLLDFNSLYEDLDDYGYYNPENDSFDKFSLSKPSQQKITLKILNRLKKARRTKELEKSIKKELLGAMYGIEHDSEE